MLNDLFAMIVLPPGYAFLLFKFESSVHKLLLSCKPEGEKHFIYMPTPTPTLAKKKVFFWEN